MHIEHTSLEDNITHVLNIGSSSASAAQTPVLLAHEEYLPKESVAELQLLEQAGSVGYNLDRATKRSLPNLLKKSLQNHLPITTKELDAEEEHYELFDVRDDDVKSTPVNINEQLASKRRTNASNLQNYNIKYKNNINDIEITPRKISREQIKINTPYKIHQKSRLEEQSTRIPRLIPIKIYIRNEKFSKLPSLIPCSRRVSSTGSDTSSNRSYHSSKKYNGETPYLSEEKEEYLMGVVELMNALKKLIGLKASNNHQEDRALKRRSSVTPVEPNSLKYRKVSNQFPKFVTKTINDDLNLNPAYYSGNENQIFQKPSASLRSEMTQRRSLHAVEKNKPRKSYFEPPQVSHKIVKNIGYAEDEFSDRDSESNEIGMGNIRKPQKIFNIPITREHRPYLPKKPATIEKNTGNGYSHFALPEMCGVRKPTYVDVLCHNLPQVGKHADARDNLGIGYVPFGATTSSAGAAAATPLNDFCEIIHNNALPTHTRSILTQEMHSSERDKYQQLLEQMSVRSGKCNAYLPGTKENSQPIRQRSSFTDQVANSTARSGTIGPNFSSIDLDEYNDDVTFIGVDNRKQQLTPSTAKPLATIIVDDDDIIELSELSKSEQAVVSQCRKIKKNEIISVDDDIDDMTLPVVEPVNSLRERFEMSPHLKDDWLESFDHRWNKVIEERGREVNETTKIVEKCTSERRKVERELRERMRDIAIFDPRIVVIDDFPEPEEDEEPSFVELTDQHRALIQRVINSPLDKVHVSKFNLNIKTRDLATLTGKNWLNDEVINFYMNLLTERSEKKHSSHGLPTVYAMNTFFIPRLMQAGHSGVKRWTRKVDIFSKDIIPVPVHVSGVHWCMAIIHIKNRTIKYYDSMGTPNATVLNALEQYLKDESIDKKKTTYDTSNFVIESVRDVPHQKNGSDCGVFSCMFAEYITRDKDILFTQENMDYFRDKMIVEIVQGELLQ